MPYSQRDQSATQRKLLERPDIRDGKITRFWAIGTSPRHSSSLFSSSRIAVLIMQCAHPTWETEVQYIMSSKG